MTINIIEPALINRAGHHFDWCLKIAKYLSKNQHESIKIFVSKNITNDAKNALSLHGEVVPLFTDKPYRSAQEVDPLCGVLTLYFDQSVLLASALQKIDQNCLWIWPTLFEYQLNALSLAKIRARITCCIHTAPEYRSTLSAMLWRDAAIRAKNSKLNISFGATFSELAKLFEPLLQKKIATLPILVDALPMTSPKTELKRIGFFGDQTKRKGLHLLPSLIKKLSLLGYKIIVQDSKGQIDGKQSPGLTVLGYVEDLAAEISKCDLIVLPYDIQAYQHMASAIAWEAVAVGVPVIAPANTVPGNFILDQHAGVAFESFTVDDIVKAVEQAKQNYHAIAAGAFHVNQNWSSHHGTAKFTQALLAQTLNEA